MSDLINTMVFRDADTVDLFRNKIHNNTAEMQIASSSPALGLSILACGMGGLD